MKKRLIIASMILTLAFVGCGASTDEEQAAINSSTEEVTDTVESNVENNADNTAEDTIGDDAKEPVKDTSEISALEDSKKSDDAKEEVKPEGKYSGTFTEEIDGQVVSYEDYYIFNSDGTGICDMQDIVEFTWDKDYIYMCGSKYPFKVNGDCLSVTGDFGTRDYYKK